MAARAAVLFVATLVLWYPAWAFIWVFVLTYAVPRASPVLAWLNDRPSDTYFGHSFKDGPSWRYCRNTRSGHIWVTDRMLKLQFGSRCQPVPMYLADVGVAPSYTAPALVLGRSGSVSFVVPYVAYQPCPSELSATYLARSKLLLSETAALDDLDPVERQILNTASGKIAAFSEGRLTMDQLLETRCDLSG